jgi:hypothetical protein
MASSDLICSEREKSVMSIMKTGLSFLALGFVFLEFASPDIVQAAGDRINAARAAAIHKCSVLAFRSAKEYNSSGIPWYTYTTCMAEHGQRP